MGKVKFMKSLMKWISLLGLVLSALSLSSSTFVSPALMKTAGPRLFSTGAATHPISSHEALSASHLLKPAVYSGLSGSGWIWTRAPGFGGVRFSSTVTLGEKAPPTKQETDAANPKKTDRSAGGDKGEKGIDSYWGVEPNKITREDGTEWKWNCFRLLVVVSNRIPVV